MHFLLKKAVMQPSKTAAANTILMRLALVFFLFKKMM